jgi:hypothetical protein
MPREQGNFFGIGCAVACISTLAQFPWDTLSLPAEE